MDASVSNAADSIGLKDVPEYDIEVCEQEDWVKKSQVWLLLFETSR